MNITISAPPELSGDSMKDTEALSTWCHNLYTQLRRILYSLDSSNIVEVASDTLSGEISLLDVSIKGARLKITNDEFILKNSDSSQYLKLSGDKLTFSGTVVGS